MKRAAALAALALLIRVAAIAYTGFDRVEFGDARDFLDTAASLCEHSVYPVQGNLPFFRAPGLPFFIALVTACEPQRVALVKIALALVDSVTVALIVLLSGSVWAGLAAAVYPLFVMSTTDIRSEPLFMFFLVLALFGLRKQRPALSGASLALAALTRPIALIFVPLFALGVILSREDGEGSPAPSRRRGSFAALRMTLGFLLVLAPWTIRNYVRFGEFILVNDASGYSLWRGTHPEMARIYSIRDREAFRRASIEFEQRFTSPMTQRINASASTPRERSAAWRNAALANIKAYPKLEAAFALKKALIYWRPWLNPQEYSAKVVLASGALTIALYALALCGLAHMERRVALWIAAFFVVGWLAHIPHQVVTRFRYPLTDPLLLIIAAKCRPIARFRTSTPPQ